MNEKAQRIGQIALLAAFVGSVGMGIKDEPRRIAEIEQVIDARCGGPTRPDCVRIEKRVPVPHFDGTVGSTTIVEFIPKTLTMTPEKKEK